MPFFSDDFGPVKNPCADCWDGHCTMNCSGREPVFDDPNMSSSYLEATLIRRRGTVTFRGTGGDIHADARMFAEAEIYWRCADVLERR